jgi:hypothetical protein
MSILSILKIRWSGSGNFTDFRYVVIIEDVRLVKLGCQGSVMLQERGVPRLWNVHH